MVAAEKRFIRCVSFGSRSLDRTCHLARLTRAWPIFTRADADELPGGNDSDSANRATDNAGTGAVKASQDYGMYGKKDAEDHKYILDCGSRRQKRTLLPCTEKVRKSEL